MDTGHEDAQGVETSTAAGWITVVALVITAYLAIWQIDWDGSVVAPIGFVLITSGVVGALADYVVKRLR